MNTALYGNAVVGQSGGPTAAINATLAGVIRGAMAHPEIKHIYGAVNGVEGLLKEQLALLDVQFEDEDSFTLLSQTPAAALGSCRKKLKSPKDASEVYEKLFEVFRKFDIRYFFYIGGNDSMDTVAKLSEYAASVQYDIRVMGVPKTIDNDVAGTDHTPGFGSAAKYVAVSVQEILRDCAVYTVPAVTIVEIMGRDAGWLTSAASLPRRYCGIAPDYIYLPERVFSYESFYRDVKAALACHPNVVIAVSEGLRLEDGSYVGESGQSGEADVFGHKYLAGTAKVLALAVREKFGCKVRSVELNILQRCASHMASMTDISESLRVGASAVDCAVGGETAKMMRFVRLSDKPYTAEISPVDIRVSANSMRCVPDAFISPDGNDVTEACIDYLLPLCEGEGANVYRHGLPVHFVIDKTPVLPDNAETEANG